MKFSTPGQTMTLGGFSKSHWIREQQPSEKELLESLCHEIRELARDSKYFEKQYQSLLNYYGGLTAEVVI